MKRNRGRPPKPPEYWTDLVSLSLSGRKWTLVLNCGGKRTEFPRGLNLLDACRRFIKKHSFVRWCDVRTGEELYRIDNAHVLRTRITEARRMEARRRKSQPKPIDIKMKWTAKSTFIGSRVAPIILDRPAVIIVPSSSIVTTATSSGHGNGWGRKVSLQVGY